MRLHALLAAAVLAAVPAAASADGPPVQILGQPTIGGGIAEVQVWIAYGYGKQILIDNDWNERFGINDSNAAKQDGDVVVRFATSICDAQADQSLVGTLGDWFDANTQGLPGFFVGGPGGWIWTVDVPLTGCECEASAVIKFHCANGSVHTTCDINECGSAGTITVQALNRPTNLKCTTDLTGDGVAECDAAELGPWGTGAGAATLDFTSAAHWTLSGTCDEPAKVAGTCVAVCEANQNGTDTTITYGYGGITSVQPEQDCNNTCEAIAETTVCEPPSENGGYPGQNDQDPGSGGNGGGRADPRLLKLSPSKQFAPAQQFLKRQPARSNLRPTKVPLL